MFSVSRNILFSDGRRFVRDMVEMTGTSYELVNTLLAFHLDVRYAILLCRELCPYYFGKDVFTSICYPIGRTTFLIMERGGGGVSEHI